MKLTLELTRDTHGRPVVLAHLEGGWPSVEECRVRRSNHFRDGTPEPEPTVPYHGHNPRDMAGRAAAALLGASGYVRPTDELPNADGNLVYVYEPTTR